MYIYNACLIRENVRPIQYIEYLLHQGKRAAGEPLEQYFKSKHGQHLLTVYCNTKYKLAPGETFSKACGERGFYQARSRGEDLCRAVPPRTSWHSRRDLYFCPRRNVNLDQLDEPM